MDVLVYRLDQPGVLEQSISMDVLVYRLFQDVFKILGYLSSI